jgi:hypothetical protein
VRRMEGDRIWASCSTQSVPFSANKETAKQMEQSHSPESSLVKRFNKKGNRREKEVSSGW